jgi:hypothetical protein
MIKTFKNMFHKQNKGFKIHKKVFKRLRTKFEDSLLDKSSCLAAALGVAKFVRISAMTLVTL